MYLSVRKLRCFITFDEIYCDYIKLREPPVGGLLVAGNTMDTEGVEVTKGYPFSKTGFSEINKLWLQKA
ncbi:hypothetical protein J11TS1_08090 [Oceanobacillus sp. J11TS1]|nr:hypothetical protein J11TS1_08090 [Oceanobacillus sp. J11TS1]